MNPKLYRSVLVFLPLVVACTSARTPKDVKVFPVDSVQNNAAIRRIEGKMSGLRNDGPRPFDKPDEAASFFMSQRLGTGMRALPMEHLRDELERLESREQENGQSPENAAGVLGWSSIGPGNIGGRTRALVIDPGTPDTMFAAGVAGGVWKTIDAGASWAATDDMMLNLAVSALAMDPSDSSVLYAGTGEGYLFADSFGRGLGIYKSMDSGTTWDPLAGTTSGVPVGAFDYVNKVVVSPANSNRVFAATRTGVWRSTDAGQSWSVVLANPQYLSGPSSSAGCPIGCTELVVRNDRDPETLFACFGSGQKDGLYRSLDGGNTWQAYIVPDNQGRMTLALAPSDQDVLYLCMADNGTGGSLGKLVDVFRSEDGGDSFTSQVNFQSVAGPWLLSNLVLATGCVPGSQTYSQGWHDNIIAVDPIDSNTVWVGGIDMFRSTDQGRNFELASYWFYYAEENPPPYYLHPDHHEIVFHPDYNGLTNRTMYVGNDGGVWRTENATAATSVEDCPFVPDDPLPEVVWESLNNGYGVTQFYHGDSAKGNGLFLAGAQDNGTNRVLSSNTPNDWRIVHGGDGGYCAVDPRDSQTLFATIQFFPSIYKSVDGGATFVESTTGITDSDGLFITPLAMDQEQPDVLWTGGNRPWRTLDGGATWQVAGPNFPAASKISAIAIAPTNSNVVYLGFKNGYVARTLNGLAPSPVWQVFANGLQAGWVSSVAVDPSDVDVAYCTYSNYGVMHVMKTQDGGASWASIDGISMAGIPDIPAHWITVRPCNPLELYVGTELGVFWSSDGGLNWDPANDGLAHTVVECLDFQGDNTLIAYTFGRGAFRTELEPCPRTYQNAQPVPTPVGP